MICIKLPARNLSLLFKGRYSLIKSVIVMESRRNLPRKARDEALVRIHEEKSGLNQKVPAKKRGGENPDEAVAKKGEKPVKNDEKPTNGAVSKRAKAKQPNGDEAEAATKPKTGKSKTDDDIAPKRKEKPKARRSKSVEPAPVSKPAKKARKAEEPIVEEPAKKPRGKKTPSVEPEPTANGRSRKKANPTPEEEEEEEVPTKKSKGKKTSPENDEEEVEPSKRSKTKHTNSTDKEEDEEVPAKKSKTKKTSPEKDEEEAEPSKGPRAKQTTSHPGTDDEDAEPTKKTKGKKKVAETNGEDSNGKGEKLSNKTETDYSNIDFTIKEKFNQKIVTWNVAGLRALVKKNPDYITHENADIVCLNEIKCTENEIPEEYKVQEYENAYWNIEKGEGGVGILSKVKPISVVNDLPDTEFSNAKRMITAEYKNFYLVSVYVVNAGRGLKTLDKRMEWNIAFDNHVKALDAKKPVIIAGDMNVSHQEIDLSNPKTNKKNAGFTQEERDGFTQLLSMGFVDTFRHFHPDKEGAYTFWSYMGNSRSKNVGWRLDYFLASKRFMKHVKANVIRSTVLGSDHCPVVLFLDL